MAVAGAAVAAPPEPRYAPKGLPGADGLERKRVEFLYASAAQQTGVHTGGAGATIMQAAPTLGPGDFHSLGEFAVESPDGKQVVEIGWTVDQGVNGDLQPHVFSFHWIDHQATCYNGCGWVQVSATHQPGMAVVPGEAHDYDIELINGDWWLFFDGDAMGYYPQALWGGRFPAAGLVQWYGEVAAAAPSPCTQMGNGKFGTDPTSTSYDGLRLYEPGGIRVPAAIDSSGYTSPPLYNVGRVSATSFGFGGPGVTTGCCLASTCVAMNAECGSVIDPTCPGNMLNCGSCDGVDVCSPDHTCVLPSHSGGCCDAGASGPGSLVLGALVALRVRRRARRT